ncbi:MAG: hypothetical protein HY808_15605 [Nitrospirae bacterium]|nr:hypothetical protein [Nitrospirota bacterium]
MKPEKVIKENFLRNFLLTLLLIIFFGTAVYAVVFYLNIHKPLDTHYSAIITIITDIRESLVIKTFSIGAAFFILTAAGAGLLSLLYTHRIAGPLYRVRQCAKSIAEGSLDTVIKFRSRDAINAFAEAINEMTGSYGHKVTELALEIKRLKGSLTELGTLIDNNEETKTVLEKIHSSDKRIKDIIGGIKL